MYGLFGNRPTERTAPKALPRSPVHRAQDGKGCGSHSELRIGVGGDESGEAAAVTRTRGNTTATRSGLRDTKHPVGLDLVDLFFLALLFDLTASVLSALST